MRRSDKKEYIYFGNILAIFDDDKLMKKIEKWAENKQVRIITIKEYSDLLAIGCFAIIIDRKALGKENWNCYLNVLTELSEPIYDIDYVKEDFVCVDPIYFILDDLPVDDINNLNNDFVFYINKLDDDTVNSIIKIIDHEYYQRPLPS